MFDGSFPVPRRGTSPRVSATYWMTDGAFVVHEVKPAPPAGATFYFGQVNPGDDDAMVAVEFRLSGPSKIGPPRMSGRVR